MQLQQGDQALRFSSTQHQKAFVVWSKNNLSLCTKTKKKSKRRPSSRCDCWLNLFSHCYWRSHSSSPYGTNQCHLRFCLRRGSVRSLKNYSRTQEQNGVKFWRWGTSRNSRIHQTWYKVNNKYNLIKWKGFLNSF